MIRRRQLLPDQQIHTQTYGAVPCISDQAFDQAMLDLAAMIRFAGGWATVGTTRHPTDLPGEMVTIHAAFEWKDRTDAKPQAEVAASPQSLDAARERLQAEADTVFDHVLEIDEDAVPLTTFSQEEPPPEDDPEWEPPDRELDDDRLEGLPSPDGLDYDELPEEDLSAIPAEQR